MKVVSVTEYLPDTPEAIIFESMLEGFEQSNGHYKLKNKFRNLSSDFNVSKSRESKLFGFYRILQKALSDEKRRAGMIPARRLSCRFLPLFRFIRGNYLGLNVFYRSVVAIFR